MPSSSSQPSATTPLPVDAPAGGAELDALRQQLADTERRLQAILDHVPATVFLRDVEGRWVAVNEALARVMGLEASALLGQPLEHSHSPEQAAAFRAEDAEVLADGRTHEYEVAFHDHSRGEQREWLLQKFPVADEEGRLLGIGGISVDITERRTAERELRASQQLFSAAFDHAPVGKLISRFLPDGTTEVLQVNPAFAEMVGVGREQIVGTPGALLCHADDIPVRERLLSDAAAGRPSSAELRLLRFGGGHVWARIAVVLAHAADGTRLLVIQAIDVTERRDLEQRLRELADHDELTGLLSRRRFLADLEREIARGARGGGCSHLLLLDLDDFKQVNDRQGHAAGDAVLRRVADVMTQRLRESDVIGRLGGDEFAVILTHTDAAGAQKVAADLTAAFAAPGGAGVSASAGLIELTSEPVAVLIARADAAMYGAKHAGGQRLVTA